MDVSKIIEKVDTEKLYQHILKLEGPKHPLDNPKELNEAADFILSEFKKYGINTNDQQFYLEEYDFPMRNIEGFIGDGTEPEFIIISHYDTMPNTPGANDNASAVALMLESARILSQEKEINNIRFLSFTLEESNHHFEKKFREKGLELGIFDDKRRYTSAHIKKMMEKFREIYVSQFYMGTSMVESYTKTRKQLENEMGEKLTEYIKVIEDAYKEFTEDNWIGNYGLIGATHWVNEAVKNNKKIKGFLNFDTIAYTDKKKSPTYPLGLTFRMYKTLFTHYKFNEKNPIGDYITILGEVNSKQITESFCANCQLESIDLPYISHQKGFTYEQFAKRFPVVLRGEHTPFWRAGYPGLFMSDTADFRYPFYHTAADTIDKIDFDFLTKLTKAAIATAIDFSKK
ncbi:MAG: M28 family peptidase [archaeon]|nr:M28 family peptidase [archaeon]